MMGFHCSISFMKDRRAFSLLEMLIASIIVTVAFTALIIALTMIMKAGGSEELYMSAAHLAQDKMEEIRNMAYSDIDSEAKSEVPDFPAFTREVIVTTPSTGIKQIATTVEWLSGEDTLDYTLQTYRADI